MRRLIINADDFGLTSGVNRAITEAHQRGVVTSATLMASAAGFEDAVQLARANPKLSVGCHIVLLDGLAVSPPETVPSLIENNRRPLQPAHKSLREDGNPLLRHKLLPFASAALRGRLPREELAREIEAQVGKIQSAGIKPTHLDTHKHAHIFPAIFKPLLEVASKLGIRAVRNPFAPIKPLAFAHLARRPRLWTRYSEVRVVRRFVSEFRREVAERGMVTTDGSFGVVVTGALDLALFESIIGCIPEGTWEFVCHPGYNDADLGQVRTRLRQSRVAELEVLTSTAARKAIEKHGIELISYRDLAAGN